MKLEDNIKMLQIMRINLNSFPEVGAERKKIALDAAIDTMYKYQILQADYKSCLRSYKQLQVDYNARLKDDMVDMLTEIQLEIEEMEILASITDGHGLVMREDITALIQQKIDKIIKENDNGNS